MAHFAKIEDNIVTDVVVVSNEHESYGNDYLNELGLTGTWIQTSYNRSFRGKYAAIGDVYNQEQDRFEPVKPFNSWLWDNESCNWIPPVPYPALVDDTDTNVYKWDETSTSWVIA